MPRKNALEHYGSLLELAKEFDAKAGVIRKAAAEFLAAAGRTGFVSLAHGRMVERGLEAADKLVSDLRMKIERGEFQQLPETLMGTTKLPPALPPSNLSTSKTPENLTKKRKKA